MPTRTARQRFTLTSNTLVTDNRIPAEHTCDGSNTPPALQWINPPAGTKSYALILDDPDAPDGTFTHWVVYDIPAETTGLSAGESNTGKHGRNDFQTLGYRGPCPPPRHGPHRYNFNLFALDIEKLGLAPGATRQQVQQAMIDHVLGRTRLVGRYSR